MEREEEGGKERAKGGGRISKDASNLSTSLEPRWAKSPIANR